MTLKDNATSAVLGLLFVSLLAIFFLSPRNGLITFLAVLIMLVGLVIAQSRNWRDIAILAGVSALVSLVAVALVGQARFGQLGTVVTIVIWGGVLLVFFLWLQRSLIAVPQDQALLVQNQYDGSVTQVEGPISAPLTPFVDDLVATIPLYDLSEEISVKDINTNAKHNIDEVRAYIRYNVVDPQSVFRGIPKRAQAEQDVLKEIKNDAERARHNLLFWEKLLGQQMRLDAEDVIRVAIFDTHKEDNKPYSAVDVYDTRRELTTQIKNQLNQRVQRWGVDVSMVELDYIKVDGERFKSVDPEKGFARAARQKEAESQRESTYIRLVGKAQAEAEAQRIRELIEALRSSGVELSAQDLHEIVIDAIRATADNGFENAFARIADDKQAHDPKK